MQYNLNVIARYSCGVIQQFLVRDQASGTISFSEDGDRKYLQEEQGEHGTERTLGTAKVIYCLFSLLKIISMLKPGIMQPDPRGRQTQLRRNNNNNNPAMKSNSEQFHGIPEIYKAKLYSHKNKRENGGSRPGNLRRNRETN